MKYLPLNPGLFVKNRERFISRMEKNSIAIFVSNDEVPSNGDAIYRFKQNSDVFWLSGITQEDSMVILFPGSQIPGSAGAGAPQRDERKMGREKIAGQ